MDVGVDRRIARQGEQQLLHGDLVHHHGIRLLPPLPVRAAARTEPAGSAPGILDDSTGARSVTCPRESSRGAGAWHALSIRVMPAARMKFSTMRSDTSSPRAGRFARPASEPVHPLRRERLDPDAAGDAPTIGTTDRLPPACFPVRFRGEMLRQSVHRPEAARAHSDVGFGARSGVDSCRYSVGLGLASVSDMRSAGACTCELRRFAPVRSQRFPIRR